MSGTLSTIFNIGTLTNQSLASLVFISITSGVVWFIIVKWLLSSFLADNSIIPLDRLYLQDEPVYQDGEGWVYNGYIYPYEESMTVKSR